MQCFNLSYVRRLVSYDTNASVWTTLMENAFYSSYSVLAANMNNNVIAIGNISGSLMLLFVANDSATSTVNLLIFVMNMFIA